MGTTPPATQSDHSRPTTQSDHSTPPRTSHKGSGKNHAKQITSSGQPPTPHISQDHLKLDMKLELSDATWVMSAIDLARSLSRKTRTADKFKLGDTDKLANYKIALDELSWTNALKKAVIKTSPVENMPDPGEGERVFYKPLVAYFNKCLAACKAVIPVRGRARYNKNLRFHEWDIPTQDGIRGAAPVKPDIVGGGEMPSAKPAKLWWRTEKRADTLEIPVEVKDNRAELIAQCATYARCLMDARPHRQFSLVISYQQTTKDLHFLVFHAGGLTASDPLDPTSSDGHKSILRFFLSLLTWETPGDAGFPEWGNDYEMVVPKGKDGTEGIHLHLENVIYDRLCLRGRGPKVQIMCPGPPPSPPEVNARTVRAERRAAAKDSKVKESEKPTSPLGPGGSKKKSFAGGSGSRTQGRNMRLGEINDSFAQISIADGHSDRVGPLSEDIIPEQDEAARLCKLGSHANPKFVMQDDRTIIVPIEDGAKVVSKTSWVKTQTAKIERDMLSDCNGQFGIVTLYQSGVVYHREGIPVTNHLWLEGVTPWTVFDGVTPSEPDLRLLMQHLLEYAGESLVNVRTAKELFTAIVHAAIGYRNLIQSGFQHRDISIGNVLWMKEAVKTTRSAADDITEGKHASELQTLVKGLEGLDKCHGFIIDGDMAIRISKEYFSQHHEGTRSGTEVFMSTLLLEGRHIWHSPVDDLWSLFFVAQWAAVRNRWTVSDPKYEPLQKLSQRVAGSVSARGDAKDTVRNMLDVDDYGPLVPTCSSFFHRWATSLGTLEYAWRQDIKKWGPTPDLEAWADYANKGVLDLVQLFKEFTDKDWEGGF